MPDKILHDLTLKVPKRTLAALAALRKLLKSSDAPIVARAVAELAARMLKQKARGART